MYSNWIYVYKYDCYYIIILVITGISSAMSWLTELKIHIWYLIIYGFNAPLKWLNFQLQVNELYCITCYYYSEMKSASKVNIK